MLELSILAFFRMQSISWVTQFHSLSVNAMVQELFCFMAGSVIHYATTISAFSEHIFTAVSLMSSWSMKSFIYLHHTWREKFASLLKSVIWKVVLSKLYTDYLTNFACVKISFISAAKLLECFAWRNQLLSLTREIWSAHNKNLSEIIDNDQTTSKQL